MEEPPAIGLDIEQLRGFALEAEERNSIDIAAKYHQDIVAKNRGDVQSWYEYGTFCMRIGDMSKAEECLREVVTIDQQHVSALIMLGVVAAQTERFQLADNYLDVATGLGPQNVAAWTIRGLYFSKVGNDLRSEMALTDAASAASQGAEVPSIFLVAANFLLTANATELADSALARHLLTHGKSAAYYITQAQLCIKTGNMAEVGSSVRLP